MHTLTSSIFLPAYMTPLSISQRRTILRTYLLIVLLTAIARGRPNIDFEYLMSADPFPIAPGSEPATWNKEHVISNPTRAEARNPWLSIVESSLYHHGELYLMLAREGRAERQIPMSLKRSDHWSTTTHYMDLYPLEGLSEQQTKKAKTLCRE